ncbi:MAG: c-type cytochrome biogenesis protein CcmI [Rhodospirillaceae bacterium]|nr:c-type cytochrome biogenesis protein CcmI [Rhodospirillaceae bacterium]
MLLWILAAVLTAAAVAPLVGALARGRRADSAPGDRALAVYRDQLLQVARDEAQGNLSPAEAEGVRTEVSRRMLTAASAGPAPQSARPARRLALVLSVLLPLAALGIYLAGGRPDLPSQPLAARDRTAMEAHRQMLAETAGLARQLEAEDGSAADWAELGQRYRALGRGDDAVAALARAVGLAEDDPEILAAYAEALVEADAGIVSEQAQLAFQRVLEMQPLDPRPHHYLALARAQAGDDEGALAGWQALMRMSPADAPWVPMVAGRIAETAQRLGLDPGQTAIAPMGVDPDAARAAAALPPEEQAEMIRSMVDGLAARLEQQPDDLDGWLRLGQSYGVLGRPADAAAAFARAATLAPDDPAILAAQVRALMTDSSDGVPTAETVAVLERLHALEPGNGMALWLLGVAALTDGRAEEAAGLWRQLLDMLPEGSEERRLLQERLEAIAGAS